MKRKKSKMVLLILAVLFPGIIATAQEEVEKKTEKKVKIVTIDEEGNRIEKDTVLAGENRFHILKGGGNDQFIYTFVKSGKESSTGTGENVYIMKKGEGGTFTITESDSMVWVGDGPEVYKAGKMIVTAGDEEGSGTMVFIGEPGVKSHSVIIKSDDGDITKNEIITGFHSDKPAEGESVIMIRTHDGEEVIKIKGDAVITIKDGAVKVENSNEKGKEVKKEGEVKTKKK